MGINKIKGLNILESGTLNRQKNKTKKNTDPFIEIYNTNYSKEFVTMLNSAASSLQGGKCQGPQGFTSDF